MMTEKQMTPIVEKWLQDNDFEIAREVLISGYCDLVGFRFAERTSRRIPQLLNVITVELKVDDILGVTGQAINNKHFVNSSYAAMPFDKCKRMRAVTIERFRQNGIGLLGINNRVKVIIKAETDSDKNVQWMTRKFWRWHKQALKG